MKNRWFNMFWALMFAFALANCANSDFAGTSAKKSNSKAGLRDSGDSDAADGGLDSDGGPDSGGGFDSGDGPDGGFGNDGGRDGDGDDFGGDSDGGNDSDGDGNDDDDDGDDDGLEIDGGDQSLTTRHDMKINRTREDEDTTLTISLLDNDDDEIQTETVKLPKKGEVTLANMCRNDRLTRIRLTINGSIRPGDKCYFEKIVSDNAVQIDVDTNGAGFIGTCKPGEDETFTITCPKSDELEIDRF